MLRLLRNQRYAGRQVDGSPAIHTAIVQPELFDRVQAIITGRRTRETATRAREDFDDRSDPFILRGLLTCGHCGHTMSPAMSVALTNESAKVAPRYYRCRTESCKVGQIVAEEIERLAYEAMARPPAEWPDDVKSRLASYAAIWTSDLWPFNKRRILGMLFSSMAWHLRPERLEVVLNDPMPGDDA